MTRPRLHVLLLGTPVVLWEDKPLTIPRRVTRMLLFYLAARGMASRGELISILWDDVGESTGRQRLRETLNKLRSALPEEDCLLTHQDIVSLDPEKVFIDLSEFNRLMNHAGPRVWKTPTGQPLPDEILHPLREAVQLWRSPFFMAGADILDTISMNEWLRGVAEQSEHLMVRALERLSDHELIIGELERALQMNDLALMNDRYAELLIERKLRLLIQSGRLYQAQQDFNEYQHYLQETSGLVPGPDLQAIFHRINLSLSAPAQLDQAIKWEVRPSTQVPFVGRQKYLALLRQAYFHSHSLILLGESGQGKTRLFEEFSATLKPVPLIFLAKCRVASQSLPLQPLIDAMRRSVPQAIWSALPQPVIQVLAPIFPELVLTPPVLDPLNSPEQTRTHIFEALRQVFVALAEGANPLLILDDAQWADMTTLAAVAYLMHRPPLNHKGMVLLAARVEEQTRLLRGWIEAESTTAQVIHLGAMNLREITELATQILGRVPDPLIVERLSFETGGNTFFILETLRALSTQPIDSETSQEIVLPLTEGITALLQTRLNPLQPNTRQFLEAAAIGGTEFSLAVVCQASGLSKDAAAEALKELEERYLVEPVTEELPAARYRFIHDKVKEALLVMLNPLQLQVLHRRVADAILAEYGALVDQRPAMLAEHYGLAGDWDLAFPWWVKAVERARQLFAVEEGAEALHNAEKIIERHYDRLDVKLICQLYRIWSGTPQISGDPAALQDISAKLLRLGELCGSPLLKGAAYLTMADLDLVQGQFSQGEIDSRQAIASFEQTDNLFHLTNARSSLGVFQYLRNRINDALQTLESALKSIEAPANQFEIKARANIYYQLGLAHVLKGWPAVGRENAWQSLADYKSINLLDGIIAAYSLLTVSNYFCGDFPAAQAASQSGLELAVQRQAYRMIGYIQTYRGTVKLAQGNLDECQKDISQAIEVTSQYKYNETLLIDYRIFGDAYYWLRDYPRSSYYRQLSQQGGPERFLAPDHDFRFCLIRYLEKRNSADLQGLEEARLRAVENGLDMATIAADLGLAIIAAADQDWERLKQEAGSLLARVEQQGIFLISQHATQFLALAELKLGHADQAIQRLENLYNTPHKPLQAWMEIEILCTLNAALHQAARPTQAVRKSLEIALASIASHCTHPDFLPSFQAYHKRVLEAANQYQPLGW